MTTDSDYRLIPLTRGQHAMVDAEVFDELSAHVWQAHWDARGKKFYAVRTVRVDGKRKCERMHRRIMGLPPSRDPVVDHISGDTLDNRRSNLRVCAQSNNVKNARVRKDSQSQLRGAFRFRPTRTWNFDGWFSRIRVNGKAIHLGYFATPEEANAAYADAAKRLHGEFARF